MTGQPITWTVGFDGSNPAAHAAEWAVTHAQGRADTVAVVQAISLAGQVVYSPLVPAGLAGLPATVESAEEGLRRDLEHFASRLGANTEVPVTTNLRWGDDESTVLLDAAELGDLLILGTRGNGRFERLLLGSTSTRCATHSTVPTVVVPQRPADQGAERATDVVVAVDGSANSIAALDWACRFAEEGSSVTIVSVWDFTPSLFGSESVYFPDAIAHARQEFDRLLEQRTIQCQRVEVTIRGEFVQGRPREELAKRAAKADLLVVGRRGYGAIGSAILGSVSTWLLHHAQIPTVVVPAAPGTAAPPHLDPLEGSPLEGGTR